MTIQSNPQPQEAAGSLWSLLSPGRYSMLFIWTVAVAGIVGGMIAWQARMPVWGGTLIVVGILTVPMTLKWYDDMHRYGLAATALGILILLQAFHTLEHITQVVQYYVLDRPPAEAFGLISSLNAEWVHFTWNWFVVALVLFLFYKGMRNFWAYLLIAWAILHGLEHTYMLARYYLLLQELSRLGIEPQPVAQALPGILGRDGWLAVSNICGRIPGITTASRIAIHFWWNFGEIVLLSLAAWAGMHQLLAAHSARTRRGLIDSAN